MSIIYKTLFEVKVLHEFYLTESKGETIFDFAEQNLRINFLKKKFQENQASVNSDLLFQIPSALQSAFEGLHLRLLTTYSGFKIGIEVKEKKLPDGTKVYEPKVQLPVDFNVFVLLIQRNSSFNSFSNERISRSIPSIYYFTNEDIINTKTFPVLSNSIPVFDPEFTYEQGELASFGLNDVRQFYREGEIDQWSPIKSSGFVNSNDQLIVPLRFNYSFDNTENVTEARFVLKDNAGNIVRTYEVTSENVMQKVALNFREKDDNRDVKLITLPKTSVKSNSIYSLETTLNGANTRQHKLIFFDDEFHFKDYWGIVNIKPAVDNINFDLLENDGFLKTRKPSVGDSISAPIFEIRIKSRFTFWRYINDKKLKLKANIDTADFLNNINGKLISKSPRAISYLPTLFKKDANNSFHYLPNPYSNEMISRENGRLYSDILVPESKMFPVETS